MSEKTNTTPITPETQVDYRVPIDPTSQRKDVVVGVNGEFIRIKRGVTVKIKQKFVEALENANRQNEAAMLAQERAEAEGTEALAAL